MGQARRWRQGARVGVPLLRGAWDLCTGSVWLAAIACRIFHHVPQESMFLLCCGRTAREPGKTSGRSNRESQVTHRSVKVLLGLALINGAALPVGRDKTAFGRAPSPTRCTMEIRPGTRDSLTPTLLLGRPSRDTIEAGPGDVDRRIWFSSRAIRIHGQVVRVDSILGPGADLVRRALNARHSSDVIVVPWANNPGCGIEVWSRSAEWTTPDSAGLFSVRLRPESLWVSGRPTFDAFFAVNYSYAYGPHTVGPHTHLRDATGAPPAGIAR